MKKLLFFSLSLFVGLVLFFIAFEKIGVENIILAISAVSLWQFLLVFGILFLAFLIGTLRWRIIINAQLDKPVSFFDVLLVRLAGFSINYLTPVVFLGGQPFKAYILKERSKVSLDKAIISIIIEEVVFLTVLFLFVILGVFFLFTHFNLPGIFNILIAGTTLFCFFIFCLFYWRIIKKHPDKKGFFTFFIELFRLDKINLINEVKPQIADIEKEIFYFFRNQKFKLAIVSFFTVGEVLLTILGYWLIVSFLGNVLNFREIFSINALINLVYFIPIPAALGSFELSQALIFDIFGLSFHSGIAFSLIVRVLNLIIVGLGIIFLIHFEIKMFSKKIVETIPKLIDYFKKNLFS